MELKAISYAQYEGQPSEWVLKELTLGKVNLLVGKNASGKTRALNVINGLAGLVSGRQRLAFRSGNYSTEFQDGESSLRYTLVYCDSKVEQEEFVSNGHTRLKRGPGGVGTIFAKKEDRDIDFQTPENELAAVARQDSVQHPFLLPLKEWGDSVYHFAFGEKLGKDRFALFVKGQSAKAGFDPKDTTQVVAVFRKGKEEFGSAFEEAIKVDMGAIGYPLDEIEVGTPMSIRIETPFMGDPVGLFVRERALKDVTDQIDMSQGMFRALSVIIQVNYLRMRKKPGCMLIDDIGEGLDFERSCALIGVLMEKVQNSALQLVMSTNDRFVMNKVPLEVWAVLDREGGECRVHNYGNSREAFEEFKMTGMNNFDFFAVDFIHEEHAVNE